MSIKQQQNTNLAPGEGVPWYKQFWPWFIISLPASAVIASFITLWLAISNPDPMVVDKKEYQLLNSELKAQVKQQEDTEDESGESESQPPD